MILTDPVTKNARLDRCRCQRDRGCSPTAVRPRPFSKTNRNPPLEVTQFTIRVEARAANTVRKTAYRTVEARRLVGLPRVKRKNAQSGYSGVFCQGTAPPRWTWARRASASS